MYLAIKKLILILLMSVFAGMVAMCLVYCLPVEPMQAHMGEIIDEFVQEGDNPFLISGYKGSSLDNYTDAIMLGNAVFRSEFPFYKAAMLVEKAENEDGQSQEALFSYLSEGIPEKVGRYGRYWHGYLVILKPLLVFMNYWEIRFLNGIASACLFLLIIWRLYKRNMKKGIVAFTFSIVSLFPMTIPFSLQFSSMYYVGMLACLVVLYKYEYFERTNNWTCFFLIVGICTSFFDFLTYPVFTFGMPFTIYIVLRREQWQSGIWLILENGFCWCLGYAGMWIGKWTVGSILTQKNLWKSALRITGERISGVVQGSDGGRIISMLRNFGIYFNPFGYLLFTILIFWILWHLYKYKKKFYLSHILLLLGTACIPVLWYMVAANHSYIHYWYTFRSLAVSVFALGMIPQIME